MALTRNESWRSVVQAYQACNHRYSRLMSHFDLTPSQFDVLLAIEALGDGAYPNEIARGLLVTKSNITSVTKRLLERKLVRQFNSESDRRSIRFSLSSKGSSLLNRAKAAARRFVEIQLEPFSDDEVELVGRMMQTMRSHLESNEFEAALDQIIEHDCKGAKR